MAITLNSTVADEFANSYVDQPYADDYFTNHWDAAKTAKWQALTTPQKLYLLVAACRVIESGRFTIKTSRADYSLRYNRLTGTIIDMTFLYKEPVKFKWLQKLQFPRNLDFHSDGSLQIPEEIKMAQCEQAVYLIGFDESAIANRIQGVTLDKVSAGRGQVDLTQEYASQGSMFAPVALVLCGPYFVKNNRMRRA